MRTETITLYKFDELSDDAKKRARDRYREKQAQWGLDWHGETIGSLKALFDHCSGVKLTDYEISLCSHSFLRVEFTQDEAAELHGARAMAWLENNLLADLRIPWSGKRRNETRKYGASYRPGQIQPGPFTGYCADDDYLDCLIKEVRAGFTLKESFQSLATVCQAILQDEHDYESSDEYIDERLSDGNTEFTESGSIY